MLITLLCIKSKTATAHVMTGMVVIFVIGITVCFAAALIRGMGAGLSTIFR